MSKAAEPLLAFLQTLPGFDVDAKNSSGDTIAHIAASRAHKDLIKLLVEAGADFSLTNNSGKIPVAMATLRDDLERFIEYTKSQMASGGGKRKASEALEGESEAKKMKIVRCVWCFVLRRLTSRFLCRAMARLFIHLKRTIPPSGATSWRPTSWTMTPAKAVLTRDAILSRLPFWMILIPSLPTRIPLY
jgi:hypothetical protein